MSLALTYQNAALIIFLRVSYNLTFLKAGTNTRLHYVLLLFFISPVTSAALIILSLLVETNQEMVLLVSSVATYSKKISSDFSSPNVF